MEKEELEEIEEEDTELDEEPKETAKKPKAEKLELDFNADPIERLQNEIDFTDVEYQKMVGKFLLEQFTKDKILAECYRNRKVTLKAVWDSIMAAARKKATSGAAVMSDEEVYGLAIHFVQDGEVKENPGEKYTLSKAEKKSLEEQARADYLAEQKRKLEEEERKRAGREKKKLEEEKKRREESGQILLFDL